MTQQQTYQNIMYLAGLEALKKLAERLSWNQTAFEAAQAELAKNFQPTLIMI